MRSSCCSSIRVAFHRSGVTILHPIWSIRYHDWCIGVLVSYRMGDNDLKMKTF
jgi:hypothetical protein